MANDDAATEADGTKVTITSKVTVGKWTSDPVKIEMHIDADFSFWDLFRKSKS